jgi:hypothetical protein
MFIRKVLIRFLSILKKYYLGTGTESLQCWMLESNEENNYNFRRLLAENGKFCAALKVLESSQVHAPKPVLRIPDIMVRIRIRGSVPLTNRSGSCYFRQWPSRWRQTKNSNLFCFLLFEAPLTSVFKEKSRHKESQNSRNQGFYYFFCLMIEWSGSGSVYRTNGSRSGRPKNIQIDLQHWPKHTRYLFWKSIFPHSAACSEHLFLSCCKVQEVVYFPLKGKARICMLIPCVQLLSADTNTASDHTLTLALSLMTIGSLCLGLFFTLRCAFSLLRILLYVRTKD